MLHYMLIVSFLEQYENKYTINTVSIVKFKQPPVKYSLVQIREKIISPPIQVMITFLIIN